MSIGGVGPKYNNEEKEQEAKQLYFKYSFAASYFGYRENISQHKERFMGMQHPWTGELLKREQGGERPTDKSLKGFVTNLDASINAWVMANLNTEQQKTFAGVIAIAMDVGRDWEERNGCFIRRNGKIEPGRYLTLNVVEARNANNEVHFHGTEYRLPAALALNGDPLKKKETFSLADARSQFQLHAERQLIEQMVIAAYLEKSFGAQVGFRNGKAVIGELSKEQVEQFATRRPQIIAFLKQHGYENTPLARHIAAHVTRKDLPPCPKFDHEQFVAEWQPKLQRIAPELKQKVDVDGIRKLAEDLEQFRSEEFARAIAERKAFEEQRAKAQEAKKQEKAGGQAATAEAKEETAKQAAGQGPKGEEKESATVGPKHKPETEQGPSATVVGEAKPEHGAWTFTKKLFGEARNKYERMVDDIVTGPSLVVGAALRACVYGPDQEYVVEDSARFLRDTSKKTLWEGHMAAIRAVRSTPCFSFNHALKVASAANYVARQPKYRLKSGDKIVVPESVSVTDEQRAQFIALAEKKKCELVIHGQQIAIGKAKEHGKERG